jgi:hypothetical protein
VQLQTGGALEDLLASVQLSASSDVRTSPFETEGHGLDSGQVYRASMRSGDAELQARVVKPRPAQG